MKSVLIANRGEIAIRIARACADLGLRSVAIYSADDSASLHAAKADEAVALEGSGVAAYLDGDAVIAAAKRAGCDAIHPGYGFLSERADFARKVEEAGLVFVGPAPEALALFGDKAQARDLAARIGAPTPPGRQPIRAPAEAEAFFASLNGAGMMVKAAAGGGGRGIRIVREQGEIAEAIARASSEAEKAFGDGALYVERLIENARHIEVQIVGDSAGDILHFYERECSVQRRHQKIIELAPAPGLAPGLRQKLCDAALALARAAQYRSLGTFEFLVEGGASDDDSFYFIEANPRLQVEHTITEEALGVDLVQIQLRIAGGERLKDMGFAQGAPAPRRSAIQLRINCERIEANGAITPTGGIVSVFEPGAGPGVRVDSYAYAGYRTSAAFDSLIAKLIVHAPRFEDARRKAIHALDEFRLEGVETNANFLRAILKHPDFVAGAATTTFVDAHARALSEAAEAPARKLFFDAPTSGAANGAHRHVDGPHGTDPVVAPLLGTVVSIDVAVGDEVRPGQTLAVLEAMKMEHLVVAEKGGIVRALAGEKGVTLMAGEPILFLEPVDHIEDAAQEAEAIDLDAIRPDLAEMRARHAFGLDENRPEAVARRRKTNHRTARENVAQLTAGGSFNEYGALAIAARRGRETLENLIRTTPADGVVAGVGTVNEAQFGAERARAMIVAYDYMVLAGTQGHMNHKKQDRVFEIAERWRLPVVLFAEGGGGRPGDTDGIGLTGLDVPTFGTFAKLSGLVPVVGVVSGRCFAGNAALLGCCDVIIATRDSNIGMGGPAMIEGGGLGVYKPEEVGPVSVQAPNGVIDVLVEDEIEAVDAARKYLSYFQGPVAEWSAPDQRWLRRAIPENRLRVYDIRHVIETLCDDDSVLELRRDFGAGMVTALVRIEGKPFGLIANNPKHLGGAIDGDAADKAARFMQLCNAHGLPIISLCDTPGFMVGPEVEKTALVRRVCRMFVVGAALDVPFFTIVLRKGYGLGAQSMARGGFHSSFFTIAWPTGEFGGMGLEGAVRLGYRKELEAISDLGERDALFRKLVDKMYEHGKACSIASALEIDGVIDPVETRAWVLAGLTSAGGAPKRSGEKRGFIDTW